MLLAQLNYPVHLTHAPNPCTYPVHLSTEPMHPYMCVHVTLPRSLPSKARIGDGNKFNTCLVLPRKTDGSPICWLEECSQFPDRCEPPFFFATIGDPEVGNLSGENAWCKICCWCDCGSSHPTAPSIWSSMSRFSSIAYSMGSSRAIGSTNPRTIMAIASSSLSPRVMR